MFRSESTDLSGEMRKDVRLSQAVWLPSLDPEAAASLRSSRRSWKMLTFKMLTFLVIGLVFSAIPLALAPKPLTGRVVVEKVLA